MKEKKPKINFVNTKGASSVKYRKVLQVIKRQRVCPFCPDNFKWHTKPILKNKGVWFITENFNPYQNTRYHFLIIGKIHKELLSELTIKDWKSILYLIEWASKKFKLRGGAITFRFGDPILTGATVKHIHCHLISPKVKNGKSLPVYFPIG